MKKIFMAILLMALCISATGCNAIIGENAKPTTQPPNTTTVPVIQQDTEQPPVASGFADKFIKYVPDDENYMISPLSISIAFGMLANGAQGETLEQILEVLEIDDINAYNEHVDSLMKQYTQTDFMNINISDSIWMNTDLANGAVFSDDFKNTLAKYYDAEANAVTNADAVKRINSWTANKTEDRITEIVNDSDFLCCLVNAIYFKAAWANQFNPELTKKDIFTSRDGTKTEIDFMNKIDRFNYYSDGVGTKIIELPYASYNNDVSSNLDVGMYLILSDKKVYPETLLNDIAFCPTQVSLSMPKFTTEYDVKLNNILANMGMTDVFDEKKADINSMFSGRAMDKTYVSDAIHKTFINVDENGTEAAAVTALLVKESAMFDQQEVEFKADRPFTYVIRDNTNGEILFMGEFAFAK